MSLESRNDTNVLFLSASSAMTFPSVSNPWLIELCSASCSFVGGRWPFGIFSLPARSTKLSLALVVTVWPSSVSRSISTASCVKQKRTNTMKKGRISEKGRISGVWLPDPPTCRMAWERELVLLFSVDPFLRSRSPSLINCRLSGRYENAREGRINVNVPAVSA